MAMTNTTASERRTGYLRIPHQLLTGAQYRGICLEAKLLYCLLLERQRLSKKNGWLDAEGRTYLFFAVEEVAAYFACGVQKARELFRQLTAAGLIERQPKQGVKCCRIYVIPLPEDTNICKLYDPFSPGGNDEHRNFPRGKRHVSNGGNFNAPTIYRENNTIETNTWSKRAIERMMAWKDEDEKMKDEG